MEEMLAVKTNAQKEAKETEAWDIAVNNARIAAKKEMATIKLLRARLPS